MKNVYQIITAVSIIFFGSCVPQKIVKGNDALRNMSYYEATKYFEQSLDTKGSDQLYSKIAFSYQKMNKIEKAIEWYKKAIETNQYKNEDLYNYAICLKQDNKIEESKKCLDVYISNNPEDVNARIMRESCDSFPIYYKDTANWKIERVNLGSDKSQFSPTYYDNGIVFCSPGEDDITSSWDGQPYLDLYHVKFTENGGIGESHLLGNSLNSVFHEGPAEFSSGYREVYFTRTNYKNGKVQKNEKNESVLRIYTANYEADDWNNVHPVSFSPGEYNTAHPALNTSEDYLYYVSDMPGGYGGFDIYRISRKGDEWGIPENLGPEINTAGNELFPTVNYDKEAKIEYLYFSSDAKHGLGGLDIYRAEINAKTYINIDHLKSPINSIEDDFGLILINNSDSGYISSSRGNTEGIDHIYKFSKVSYNYNYFMKGTVKNKKDLTTISGAYVLIIQSNGTHKYEPQSDENGEFFIQIDTNSTYQLQAKKDKFFKGYASASTVGMNKLSDTVEVDILLDPIILNLAIRLDNIYYDYNKWAIRPDAAIELDKLVKLMIENPEINIELSSHTDARGKDKYNMDLSQKRAQSAVDYIISKGISASRIYAKGYGESVILNRCKNNVTCDDDEHQLNRRTEFKVVKID